MPRKRSVSKRFAKRRSNNWKQPLIAWKERINRSLLEAARHHSPEAHHQAVLVEARRLVTFTGRTEPKNIIDTKEIARIKNIDKLADEARQDIFGTSADDIIGRIQKRASQLNQLSKSVKQKATDNFRKARELRLIPLRNAIDVLTGSVKSIKIAGKNLQNDNTEEVVLKTRIDIVVRAITAPEKAVDDVNL